MIIKPLPWNDVDTQIELKFALKSSKSPLEIFLDTSFCKSCEKMNPRESVNNIKIQLLYENRIHATKVRNIVPQVERTKPCSDPNFRFIELEKLESPRVKAKLEQLAPLPKQE